MPMTHLLEIGAENVYQKPGTINRHENRACPIRYQQLVPEKFGTKLNARRVRKPVPVFRFRYRFLVPIAVNVSRA